MYDENQNSHCVRCNKLMDNYKSDILCLACLKKEREKAEAELNPKKHRCLWCKHIDMNKRDASSDKRQCNKHKKFVSLNYLCDDWRYLV